MAVELDRIVTATHRPRAALSSPIVAAGPGPSLPDGVRPDRAEAVTALLKQPVTWLVDGWNLAFQLAPEPDAVTRERVLTAVGRLVRLSLPATMAVVVFDSSVEEFSAPADRRVRLVFAPSADEWIIETAGPATVVVTSDRRVREAAQQSGAIGLWSEALTAWITAGRSG